MMRVGPVLLLLLLAACSAADDSGSSGGGSPEAREPRDLRVERIAAGSPGRGLQRPQIVLASSAEALSEEMGAEIRGAGEGTYFVAHRGEQPTGGYSVSVLGARIEGDRVTIRFALKGPPDGAIVTQVLTYPYVIAVLKDLDLAGKEFSFVDQNGGALDWQIRRVGG
jgi:hypothetical protein